ncbi:MAG: glycosyltransferase family 2 protein [Bacteroidetes bacterium]|nr:MAG: glycosyltransferase family 2 protein [Bacteroidota bacterium]
MIPIEFFFWIFLFTIIYTYIGYPIILFLFIKIKKFFFHKKTYNDEYYPSVTLFIAAYNEKDYIDKKVKNGFDLDYPKEKINHIWITDGSNDGTPELLKKYKEIKIYHEQKRNGKIGAINRGMQFIDTPIVIFTDANTMLNENVVKEIVKLFQDKETGCVAGEKRIYSKTSDTAINSGENIYWKFESILKKWDSELYSAVGAAGEIFAIRTELFEKVEADTILDDFIISLRIVEKGYKIKYAPKAYAIESASADINEELKRKIRISAGGIQSIIRLKKLLNPFKYGIFSWQYISHKVLRWFAVPFFFPLLFLFNLLLIIQNPNNSEFNIYHIFFIFQTLVIILIITGNLLKDTKTKQKIIFIPYYIYIMNYAVWVGFYRFLRRKQGVNWERAKRG